MTPSRGGGRLMATAAMLLAVTQAAGCGSATPGGPATATTAPARSSAPATSPAKPPATPVREGAVIACASSALRLRLLPAGAAAGTSYYLLRFTNVSAANCRLSGYPGVSFVSAMRGSAMRGSAMRGGAMPGGAMPGGAMPGGAMPGGAMPGAASGTAVPAHAVPAHAVPAHAVPGHQIGSAAVRNALYPTVTVVLAPHATAHVVVGIAAAGNYPLARCHPVTAQALRVFPPGLTTAGYISQHFAACAAHVPVLSVTAVRAGPGGPGI